MSSSQQAQECCICLQAAQTRDGLEFLVTPGCCGKWFHHRCLNEYIASGGSACPLCKKDFPAGANTPAHAPSAPPAPVAVAVLPPAPPAAAPLPLDQLLVQQQVQQPYMQTQTQTQTRRPSLIQRITSVFRGDSRTREERLPMPSEDAKRSERTTEDLLTNTPTPTATAHNNNKANREAVGSAASPLTVSLTPEYAVESLAANEAFYVRVSLEYAEAVKPASKEGAEEEEKRTPLDVVCVLDTSGSMGGSKMQNLKQAVQFVLSVLDENDRLSLVTFNSEAELLLGLRRGTAENKRLVTEEILPQIRASGGTDIYAGMKIGEKVLRDRSTRNPSAAMFLLTDGQDRGNRERKLELARSLRAGESPTSLFVFGFGADHDSFHMQEIADAGEGSFIYVETSDAVIDAFGGAIGSQQSEALRNIELTFSATMAGGSVASVQSGSYRHTVERRERERDTAVVRCADLFAGERRDFVVALSLPAVREEDLHALVSTAQAAFSLNSRDAEQRRVRHRTETAECVIARVADVSLPQYAAQRTRDVKVDVEVFRLRSTTAISSAMQLADRGEIEQAQAVIAEAKAALQSESVSFRQEDPLALSLLRDLDDCASRMRSRDEYMRRGGRATMGTHLDVYSKQRQVFRKEESSASVYQTSRSANYQSSAAKSKSKSFF